MSNMLKWATEELRIAGYDINDPEDGPSRWLAEGTLELLKVFADQGHSGFSASHAVSLFERLASWKPIAPLTGADNEWNKEDKGVSQNRRDSLVFKGKDGQAYWIDGRVFWNWRTHPDIDDGKPYKSYYTSRDSRVKIESFPWTRPTEREYVFEATEEFPYEELN
jgi:hypothetical protein